MNDCLNGGGVSTQLLLHPADTRVGRNRLSIPKKTAYANRISVSCYFFKAGIFSISYFVNIIQ